MAEPLKEMFNAAYFDRLARTVQGAYPAFDVPAFHREVMHGLAGRELNARMRHTSITLRKHLPQDFRRTVGVLKEVALEMPKGYTALLYPDLVALYGLDDPAFSLDALANFTRFGSSEFAVREFLRRDLEGTLHVMRQWAEDESEHVRRLASEGSRPRLPWSFRLDAVVRDPQHTRPILTCLRSDPAPYVRKSVANHLNDISKDHAGYVVDLLRTWDLQQPATAWIAKHACRTLIKAGAQDALALFSYNKRVKVRVENLRVAEDRLALGGTLEFAFELVSGSDQDQPLVIDYAIHYMKADGRHSRKVFKLKELELPARAAITLRKRQRIVDLSTRKHYPGDHRVEILVNGNSLAIAGFVLEIAHRQDAAPERLKA